MDLDKKKKLANARRGIETADKEMGVDKLVLPEEMIHKRVDKQAMMTYLAQFRNLKDTNAAYRVRAFGEGLHKGIKETKAPFFVERPTDAKGEIKIKVLNEDGKEVSCDITKAESPAGYEKLAVSYVPQKAGVYKVHVTLDDKVVDGAGAATEFSMVMMMVMTMMMMMMMMITMMMIMIRMTDDDRFVDATVGVSCQFQLVFGTTSVSRSLSGIFFTITFPYLSAYDLRPIQ
mmetsp:Transcript_39308/g.62963  ORF Transcript_39308/g.62963 Transcript_39308/m.62963 type:complete len:232 (-) Transcript_39308:324-1019(-)